MTWVLGMLLRVQTHKMMLQMKVQGRGEGERRKGEGKGGTNERVASMASDALSDLFAHSLMPPDIRLFNLDRRPLGRYDRSSSV